MRSDCSLIPPPEHYVQCVHRHDPTPSRAAAPTRNRGCAGRQDRATRKPEHAATGANRLGRVRARVRALWGVARTMPTRTDHVTLTRGAAALAAVANTLAVATSSPAMPQRDGRAALWPMSRRRSRRSRWAPVRFLSRCRCSRELLDFLAGVPSFEGKPPRLSVTSAIAQPAHRAGASRGRKWRPQAYWRPRLRRLHLALA